MSNAPYAFSDLDQLFHVPARLGITTALYTRSGGMTFGELKRACGLSDGNLSRHLVKLEEDGVVVTEKRFVERTPQTTAFLTDNGRTRFEGYMERLRAIVDNTASHESSAPQSFGNEIAYE